MYFCSFYKENGELREIIWENTNKLLLNDGYYGLKTGITPSAGGCLSTYFKKFSEKRFEMIEFILVVLGCASAEDRFFDSEEIINWAFQEIEIMR